MFIIEKMLELYRDDLITMLQINLLTLLFSILVYDFWKERNNPLSRQVLDRMKKNKVKKVKGFHFSDFLEQYRSRFSKIEKKAELRLSRANLDFTAKEYVTFYMLGILVGSLVGFIIFPFAGIFKSILFFISDAYLNVFFARVLDAISMAALGTLTPYVWTKHLISVRKKALNEQLLEFLLSLADGVKSSPTAQEALNIVASEFQDPLATELKKTVLEIQYGIPFEDALQSLSDRIDINEYTLAINAIQIQDRTGGELEKLLRNMAKVFQERQELISEVKKIVRGPKTTSYILLVAPIGFTLMFSTMSDNFFAALFSSSIGWGCVIAAIVFYVIAFFLITRINKYIDKVV